MKEQIWKGVFSINVGFVPPWKCWNPLEGRDFTKFPLSRQIHNCWLIRKHPSPLQVSWNWQARNWVRTGKSEKPSRVQVGWDWQAKNYSWKLQVWNSPPRCQWTTAVKLTAGLPTRLTGNPLLGMPVKLDRKPSIRLPLKRNRHD